MGRSFIPTTTSAATSLGFAEAECFNENCFTKPARGEDDDREVEEALQRGEPAQPATVKPLAQPLGVVPELDPKSLALLEAAPAVRADIAQSVEQRFRKP